MTGRGSYNQGEQGSNFQEDVGDPARETYDKFRSVALDPALSTLKRGAAFTYEQDKNAANSALSKFREYRDAAAQKEREIVGEHPGVDWVVNQAMPSMAPGVLGLARPGISPIRPPEPPGPSSARDAAHELSPSSLSSPGARGAAEPDTAPISPYMLPNAKNLSGGQLGAGGSGVDNDRVLNAMRNEEAEVGGLQNKKTEEASAHLDVMGEEANSYRSIRDAKLAQANAEKQAVDEAQREQEDHDKKTQEAMDDVASKGVDPGRYFKDRNVGFWLSMLVGGVASGMLQGLTNQASNPFVDSLRAAVHSDIEAQEKGIDQGWHKVKGMETAYERMRVRGVDKVTATIRQYDKVLEGVEADVSARLKNAQIPEVKANLEAGLQSIQIERAGLQTKIEVMRKQIIQQRVAAAAAAANAEFQRQKHELELRKLDAEIGKTNAETTKTGAETEKLRGESGKNDIEDFVPTGDVRDEQGRVIAKQGYIAPKADAKEIRQQRQVGSEYVADLERFQATRAQYNKALVETASNPLAWKDVAKIRADLQAQGAHITTTYGHNEHLGSLDKGLVEHSSAVHGDATSFLPGVDVKTQTMLDTAKKKLQRLDESAGGQIAYRTTDPVSGRPVVKTTGRFTQAPVTGRPEDLPGFGPPKKK